MADAVAEALYARLLAGELSNGEYVQQAREAGVPAPIIAAILRDRVMATKAADSASANNSNAPLESAPSPANVASDDPVAMALLWLRSQSNHWGARAAERLGDGNDFLPDLELYDSCEVDDEGATHLAVALAANTVLTEINLESNSFGLTGCQALAEALRKNRTLVSLKIGGNNNVSDEAAAAIAAALTDAGGNSALRELDMSSCPNLGSVGREALHAAWTGGTPGRMADGLRL